ncbi:MAG TPA: ATP-binding protein [Tepidisphaeraceae bacterium]|jgi:signal transduction histidine kinase|nr:ATP-binding protein [Tepidisphaeraceae bacterium]
MLGLRSKILFAFGGLLLILAAVSLLGEAVLDRYSGAMQRTFSEDFQSVAVCEEMSNAVDQIDTSLQQHFWRGQPLDPAALDRWRALFDQRLEAQHEAATLPGEKEATEHLALLWDQYKQLYPRLLDPAVPPDRQKTEYARVGLTKAIELQEASHKLIDMNMSSMLSVHDKVRGMAAHFKWAMHTLSISALALAAAFAVLIGRFILRPVRLLTDCVREIEHGNLDLKVPVRSRDELGTLARAVNAMAAQLKLYRRAEHERLVRTERTTQLAIDSLPDAVVVLNGQGRIELANDTAKRLFQLVPGCGVDEPGTPWLAALHRSVQHDGVAPALDGYDATIQVADNGETRSFLPRGVPILSENKEPIGTTVVLADVTGLHRLDEMKNGLLSMVSHELKTPLTSMRMVLHLVSEGRVGDLSAKQKELLSAARDDGERLHQIVENLLDMARIESGKALMELQEVAPGQLADQAAGALRGAFDAQQVGLTVDVGPELPAVAADPIRIGHVLANLLNNALRHTPAAGHIRLWAREAEGLVEMGVTDDGAGIPRAVLPRVFEKFFRAPGQQSADGSGLGLAIARDIVEAHGGRIRADSVEGRGSTFAFTLRRAGTGLPPA